jgi:hypothetical protein
MIWVAMLLSFHPVSAPVLAYAGPDQIIPFVSILGTIIGFVLLVWQRAVVLVRRAWQGLAGRRREEGPSEGR